MQRLIIVLVGLFILTGSSKAQMKYGFKAGLNIATLQAQEELSSDGNSLETFSYYTGFHMGMTMDYPIVDRFGFRGELQFSQRGYDYQYDGDSYFIYNRFTDNQVIVKGRRAMSLLPRNSYIDLPIMAYLKPTDRLEFSLGFSVGILVGSTANGQLLFYPDENTEFKTNLIYKPFGDEAGPVSNLPMITKNYQTQELVYPGTASAYFDFEEKDGPLYNRFDFGVLAGLSFWINEGIYIGGRVNYGLTDVTNNVYDVSLEDLDNKDFLFREDNDRNLYFQGFVGFRLN